MEIWLGTLLRRLSVLAIIVVLHMLSSITNVNVSILSLVCSDNVQIVREMLRKNNGIMNNDDRISCRFMALLLRLDPRTKRCVIFTVSTEE